MLHTTIVMQLSKILSSLHPPQLFGHVLSVVAYGRLVARAFANTVGQKDFMGLPAIASPFSRRLLQTFSQSCTPISDKPAYACRLVSAVWGFSKFDSPRNRTQRVPAVSIFEKGLYGDDACFVAFNKSTDVLGVADGVGGWRAYGIDPSQFSKKLMEACKMLVKSGRFLTNRPGELLASGYRELIEDKSPLVGSSTACIVMLDRNRQTLHTANLGDSGFMIVRAGKVVHRSIDQQHFFNTPFQLSMPPEDYRRDALHDTAEDADTASFNLEIGDIILAATDGLFDNMSDKLIVKELAKLKDEEYESIKEMAKSLAEQARELSNDPEYMSPFAKEARKSGYYVRGGKPDDITIILSIVTGDG